MDAGGQQGKVVRPGQVTLAAWMIIAGSVFVVVSVFDRMGNLHTVEFRAAIEKFLAQPPGDDLGLSVGGVQQVLKVIWMVAAGCATATAVLGWQAMRRDRSARLALTVLAVPTMLAGAFAGGFFAAVVAASTLSLWTQPARSWFREAPGSATGQDQPAVSQPPAPPPPAMPPAMGPAMGPAVGPVPPYAHTAYPPLVTVRPAAVAWAAGITWVSTILTFVLLVGIAVLVASDGDRLVADMRRREPATFERSGVTDHMLLVTTVAMVVLLALWAIGAAVLAWLFWRGQEWARITLLVSTLVAAALAAIGILAGGVTLPLFVACGVVARLLWSAPAVAWCRRARVVDYRP